MARKKIIAIKLIAESTELITRYLGADKAMFFGIAENEDSDHQCSDLAILYFPHQVGGWGYVLVAFCGWREIETELTNLSESGLVSSRYVRQLAGKLGATLPPLPPEAPERPGRSARRPRPSREKMPAS